MTSSWFALETESRFCNSKAWVEVDGSMGVLKLYNRLYLSQIFHNTIIHRLCVVYYYSKGNRVRMPPQSCGPKSLSSFLSFYTSVAFFKCSGQEFTCRPWDYTVLVLQIILPREMTNRRKFITKLFYHSC